ncbi:MAG TPA: ATPase, T2SS/T4P/T4SS family [Candidatus Bathyarchaeia archaeon]|nr:ATPase, T2SS/T4P/T4SS family [Candidatus Bathyarchaeia archaeon]
METHRLETSGGGSKLRLLSLYAQNFKKLKLGKPLELSEGIILITGLNESGKSTILDAILYALFGRMIRPSQLPSNTEIISYGSGEAQVRLDFEVGNKRYRVVREVHRTRPNRAMLYEISSDGKTRTLAATVKDTTREIEGLLGEITYNEIVASTVVAQKDLERLINQGLGDRRRVINVFLNLNSFNHVQEILNEDRTRIEGTNRTPGQITLERERLKTLHEQLDDFHKTQTELNNLEERVEKLKAEESKLAHNFTEADIFYKTLSDYSESLKQHDFLRKEIETKTVLASDFESQLANITVQMSEQSSIVSDIAKYQDVLQAGPVLTEATGLMEDLKGLEFQKTGLQEREHRLVAQVQEKKMKVGPTSSLKAEVERDPRKIWTYLIGTAASGTATVLSFPLGLFATTALGSLTAVFILLLARQIATLSQHFEISEKEQEQIAIVRLLESWKDELAEIQTSYDDVKNRIAHQTAKLVDTLDKVPRYASLVASAKDPKSALEQVALVYNRDKQTLVALEERTMMLQRNLQEEPRLRERLTEAQSELADVVAQLNEVRLPPIPEGAVFSDELLEDTGRSRDNLRETLSRVKTQLEETISQIVELRRFVEENKGLAEQVGDQTKKLKLLEKELAVVKYAIKGLEHTSESLRNRVRPQVERYMGLILPAITSGRYKAVQLDEDYAVLVFDPEAGEFKPKEVFSGGTEDQLLLAMRLAFALALTPQTKGRNPEFLFLDEPLGSSDKIRREGIVQLLQKELSQSFKQIFLISHVGDLEAEADSIITMEDGAVRERVNRKPSLQEPVEITA